MPLTNNGKLNRKLLHASIDIEAQEQTEPTRSMTTMEQKKLQMFGNMY